jgi:hypothetical protein
MINLTCYRRPLALLCVYLLVLQAAAFGRDRTPLDWNNLQKLRAGAPIIVTLFAGQRLQGRLSGTVGDRSFVVRTKEGDRTVDDKTVKTVVTYKPLFANPGLYIMSGGALLGAAGGLGGTLKDLNTLNSGALPKGSSGTKFEVAGIAVAAGGVAVYVLLGKPRTVYEGKMTSEPTN